MNGSPYTPREVASDLIIRTRKTWGTGSWDSLVRVLQPLLATWGSPFNTPLKVQACTATDPDFTGHLHRD